MSNGKMTGGDAKAEAGKLNDDAPPPPPRGFSDLPPRRTSRPVPDATFGSPRPLFDTAPIPINPTVYSANSVTVLNHITINISSPEVRELKQTLQELLSNLRNTNEFGNEVKDQLKAEIAAGTELLSAPKVNPSAVKLWLVDPLRWIALEAAGSILGELAKRALELLLAVIGLS